MGKSGSNIHYMTLISCKISFCSNSQYNHLFIPDLLCTKNFFFSFFLNHNMGGKTGANKILWKAFLVVRQCMMESLECIPNFPFQLLEVCTLDYMKKCLHKKKTVNKVNATILVLQLCSNGLTSKKKLRYISFYSETHAKDY